MGVVISSVDFVMMPTHDLAGAVDIYGRMHGLSRSVFMLERNFARV